VKYHADVRVAIYAPISLWEVHLAQAIEIAHFEQEKGSEVTVIYCEGSLASCAANMSHEERKCEECVLQTKFSIQQHFPRTSKNLVLQKKGIDPTIFKQIGDLNSLESLKQFVHKGYPFGLSVFSHLVTEVRDWDLDFEKIRSKANRMLVDSIEHFYGMREILKQGYEVLYVYGGRRAAEAFAAFAAHSRGLETRYFEHGSQAGKYWITANKFFTFRGIRREIKTWREENWNQETDLHSLRAKGEEYFLSLSTLARSDLYFKHFLSGHTKVPEIDRTKPLMLIFTSSLWEFAGADEYLDCPIDFRNQYRLYQRLGSDEDLLKKYNIVFRWHPALKQVGEGEKESMLKVIKNTRGCIHVTPEQLVNSYELMNISDVIVTVGSTIGIESAAIEKPSILLGMASYSGLGAVYEPADYEEFKSLVREVPVALPKEGALIYGCWVSSYGTEFKSVVRKGYEYYVNEIRIEKRSINYRFRRWIFEQRKKSKPALGTFRLP